MRLQKRWVPLGIVGVAGALGTSLDLRVNRTESLPLGLYRAADPAPRGGISVGAPAVERGELVRFCLSDSALAGLRGRISLGRGSCPAGVQEIAKPVAGVPGDRVRHSREGVWVNDRFLPRSRTERTDSRGVPMHHAPFGDRLLDAGEFWLHSPYAQRSLDSRILGPVRSADLRGELRPLLTWRTAAQSVR